MNSLVEKDLEGCGLTYVKDGGRLSQEKNNL